MTKNDHSNGNCTRILGAVCHRAPVRKMTDMSCVCTCEGLCVYTHCVAVHECVRHEHTHMCMWMSIPVCIMHTCVLFTRVLFMCVHGTCVCACVCKSKCTCIMQNMHVLEHGTLPWPRVVSCVGDTATPVSPVLSQAHCGVIRPGSSVPPSTSLPTIATAQARAVTRNTLEAVKIQELGTWGKRGAGVGVSRLLLCWLHWGPVSPDEWS